MDVEDWKVPPEHPDHPTKLGAFDESLDQLDASISSISLPDVELRTGVDRVAVAITAMTALDPESLRGLRVSRFLRQAPWHWWRGELWTLYRFTEAVDTLEEFWSHSWRLAAWSKYVNVLFLKHAIPASLMSLLCAAVAYVLFLMELLPEWTQGPYRCSWCSFSAAGAYVLTMLLSCRQARVFLDIACINQKDARLKALGLLSLGAMLKRSKSLLVLWDATFTTRLWCVFEFGAFLHSHSGTKPRLTVVPPLQGAVCLGCGCLLATMVIAAHWGEDMVEVKSTIGISVAVPSCVLLTHMLRIYWRSIDVMRQQASSFCFEEAKCVCCERDHPQGFCDKEIIARCIVAWFGSIQHFEHRVQAEMEVTLAQQLANAAFSYDRMVQAVIPWIWLQMDVSASHSGDWTVWTRWVELSRALTIVFGILPCIMKFLCHLTFILRAQHCRMWVDVLLSLVIFVPVPVLFSGAITLEEYIVWFLIDHPYGPVYGSLLSLTMWSTITLLLWNCLPMLNLTGGAPPTDADQERS